MTKKSKTDVQNEVVQSAQKIWLAGIGALATAEEEGSKLFNSLVKKGEGYEAQGKQRVGDVRARVEQIVGQAEGSIERLGDALDEKVARCHQAARCSQSRRDRSTNQECRRVDRQGGLSQGDPKAAASQGGPKKARTKKSTTSKAN